MPFDGIITKSIVTELNQTVAGGRIDKIFEPTKNDIILGIYANGNHYALHICIAPGNYRMHLTTHSHPNPSICPNFCMLLRKHLMGNRIQNIITLGLERLVIIELESLNEFNEVITKKLVIELMGKHSNIILVQEDGKILDSIRHLEKQEHSYRDILPGKTYLLPISEKVDITNLTNFDEFYEICNQSSEKKENVISSYFTGISQSFVSYTTILLGISDWNKEDFLLFYQYIMQLLESISQHKVSCQLLDNAKDYTLIQKPPMNTLSINFFIDDFYFAKEQVENFTIYRNNLLKVILLKLKKMTKKLENIKAKLTECKSMETYRLYGELLTANLYRIPKQNMENITLENYYDNNSSITIPLDKSISPSYNAKKYFKKYNKLKNTLEIVSIQKQETEQEIEYLESIVYELEESTSLADIQDVYLEISEHVLFKDTLLSKKKSNIKKHKIKKRKAHDTYEPLIYTIDGFKVYVGKNNKQNDYLTTKLGKPDDIWFHTKDIRGSHVILKTEKKQISQETINACASLAAYYSKAKLSSSVPVDYCPVQNVKKPSGSKPGMVIYTNYKTIQVTPHA